LAFAGWDSCGGWVYGIDMLFSQLIEQAGINAALEGGDVEVDCVRFKSTRCRKGCCFVAFRGTLSDGHDFIPDALARGASAVVCQESSRANGIVPFAVVDDSRSATGKLAQAITGWPSRKLKCVGITGTNGKTTVSYMIDAILDRAGLKRGLLGTIAYRAGGQQMPAGTTTPDPVRLAEMISQMVSAGQTHLVMEVSSHALDQGRTAGIDFDVAVFTNLSGDHLDYHGDMDSYLSAKLRLFEHLQPSARAVVNADDENGRRFADACAAPVVWYGLDKPADVTAEVDELGPARCLFTLIAGQERAKVSVPVIGRHNVQNCLAAAAAANALGIDTATIADALEGLQQVPGRLQSVGGDSYSVYVDYAHTDDALHNVLSSLRPIVKGRIILVFGCGGDRDRSKRPRMAAVAEKLCDRIVITSDNPRSEPPEEIISEIASGLSQSGKAKAEIEPDRRAAIELAIAQAKPADAVLIAGKGHEKYQIVGNRKIDFDDVQVAAEAIDEREDQQ